MAKIIPGHLLGIHFLNKAKRLNRKGAKEISKEVEAFIEGNFQREGFQDVTLKPWKPLKTPRPGKILTKSGALRRSIKAVTVGKKVSVRGKQYGSLHNTGTSRLPKRSFFGPSQTLHKAVGKKIFGILNKR